MTAPLFAPMDEAWRRRAACRDLSPAAKDLFFPDFAGVDNTAAAKQICACCPVRKECLDWALQANETDGVWGGLSAAERKRIRRTGTDVRFSQCMYCETMFSFVWDSRPGYKRPNYCNDTCKAEDRREKKRLSRVRRKLGIAVNGEVC